MILIDNKFFIGQTVYLKTDPEQKERIVLEILIKPLGITYGLNSGNEFSENYDFEISKSKDINKV